MDPRIHIIDERLAKIGKIVAISGGKGGIGKSTLAATLALALSGKHYKVGLLDLDFWGPSAHIILGVQGKQPRESKGIVPPEIDGIEFMSIIYYTMDKTLALRRVGFDSAVTELLVVTQWGRLDYLIIDMPPGIGDAALDVIRLMKKVSFCVIANQSRVIMETVKNTLKLLEKLEIPIIGVVENMGINNSSVRDQIRRLGIAFLGRLDFDPGLEDAIGNPKKLLETGFSESVNRLIVKAVENYTVD